MAQPRLLSGRYLLDELVGSGGMAEVYRARDLRLNRIIAVKILRSDLASDQVFRERFRREAQSAASLSHRSIIAVHDTGEDVAGQVRVPYIVMEYQDGRTLDALLRDSGRLRPERALEITDGILDALGYSHRNGIVHRDIKPSNVMVTGEGDVKVMDFGIARSMSGSQSTITQTAEVIGTALYMSPEQARGERVDARSDLYSAGCVLYELLTGRPPFAGGSAVAIAYQHVCQDPVPPSEADPEMPRWADAIVLRAMAKAPADRYQNAGQMRAGIDSALSRAPGALPPARLLPQAQTLGAAVTPVPASQVPDGPAAAPASTGPAPGEPHGPGKVADGTIGEPPRRRKRRKALWLLAGLAALAAVVALGYLLFAGGGGKRYAVPEVRGLTQQQAGQKITADHLRPLFLNRPSRSVPNGVVIGTSPAGRTVVAAGTVVQVFVSAGQPPVPVPDVTGEDAGTARARLTQAGLRSRVRADSTSTAPANTVTRQAPPAATKVPSGSTVTIWVAAGGTGAGSTRVQDVIGDPASTAKIILTGQGFTVKEVTRPGRPSVPAGTVYRQTPTAGSVLAPGSTVTIYIEPAAPPPRIVTAPGALSVPQGSNGTFGVTLSAPPASTVTVTVSRTSGNPGLSVGSGATLTFTSSNWGTAQEVTIAADSSGAGPAAFTATAAGYQPATVTVTETSASSTAATSPAVAAAAAAGTSPQRMPEVLAAQAFDAPKAAV